MSGDPVADPAELAAVRQALADARDLAGPLLPVLHAIQDRLGWIPPAVVPLVADGLNLSRADVHGVVTFYDYFRSSPPAPHVIRLCRAEACQAVGARRLEEHIRQRLGIGADHSLEPVYCLGNCAAGPSLMIDDVVYAAVTPERFDEILGGGS